MQVNALVLAGAPNTGPLRECSDEPWEALIDVGGKPMVQFVVDALRGAEGVKRVAVVGPREELAARVRGEDIAFVDGGEGLIDNVIRGLGALPGDMPLLLATADIPLLTSKVVEQFLAQCDARPGADLYYPIVDKAVNEKKYPLVQRTYVGLKEGTFTGGNLILVRPEVISRSAARAEAFVAARKNPLRLALLLGPVIILKFFLHNLTLAELERRVSRLFAVQGAVIVSPAPEIGIDVDKPSDLKLVRAALS